MIPQGTALREKLECYREAKVQRIYYVRHWSVFIRSKYSFSISSICAIVIKTNFSSSRRRCICSSKMDIN